MTTLLFNKPFGVLCKFTDAAGRPTLADHLRVPGVYPVGRLDQDSEGLLVLTDDGTLAARIAHPRHHWPKRYWAQVEGMISDAALERLRRGVVLNDGPTRPADARRIDPPPTLWPRDPPIRYRRAIPTDWLELTITEGRNRQVRRMTAAVGLPTLRLVRVGVGPWELGALAPGEHRPLSAQELRAAAPPQHGTRAVPRRRHIDVSAVSAAPRSASRARAPAHSSAVDRPSSGTPAPGPHPTGRGPRPYTRSRPRR